MVDFPRDDHCDSCDCGCFDEMSEVTLAESHTEIIDGVKHTFVTQLADIADFSSVTLSPPYCLAPAPEPPQQ